MRLQDYRWIKTRGFLIISVALLIVGMVIGCTATPMQQAVATDPGQTSPNGKWINVKGTASKSMKPTIAVIDVGVVTQGEEIPTAQKENQTKIDEIISALKGAGIDEKDIKTSHYYVNPRYDMETYTTIIGYDVNHMLNVTVREMDKAGDILDLASAKGANQSGSVYFNITPEEREALYNEALQEAVGKGEAKAKALAKTIGVTVDKPIQVIEGSQDQYMPYSGYGYEKMAMAEEAATSFMPGDLNVTATVTLIYGY
ncbi:MAG: SIMPL domain-containing protein [Tissierellia bacterium]|nr:SIMPL domain-containing protein [Tissierellia bacterium]